MTPRPTTIPLVLLLAWCALCLCVRPGPAVAQQPADPTAAPAPTPLPVRKIYFMFHPTCWRQSGPTAPAGVDQARWTACYTWEEHVNAQQKALMDAMAPDEVLVLFPIGSSPPMKDLERHATEVLGRRAIIMRRGSVDPPAKWAELADPFKTFLEDDALEGKAAFLASIPAPIQAELAAEIRAARTAVGTGWNIAVFEVIYYSRMCAEDVRSEFAARQLHYDPATVESEAFGEGFEQCAMTWKAMLTPYLNLARPTCNIYDLSVTGAVFLRDATFRERILREDDVQLFLWEGTTGGHIAFFARARCRLSDPQYWIRVPLDGMSLEAWGLEKYGTKHWPAEGSALQVEQGHLVVPVLNAIRRDSTDGTYYLVAKGIPFDSFRQRMLAAPIVAATVP